MSETRAVYIVRSEGTIYALFSNRPAAEQYIQRMNEKLKIERWQVHESVADLMMADMAWS